MSRPRIGDTVIDRFGVGRRVEGWTKTGKVKLGSKGKGSRSTDPANLECIDHDDGLWAEYPPRNELEPW